LKIKCLPQFEPLINKEKRFKLAVGGRSSTKTTFVADYVLVTMMGGGIWCCGREFMRSISESVHRTLCDEIERLDLPGFNERPNCIEHISGGRNFYVSLGRNVLSLKGQLSGIEGVWIEEAEGTSDNTLRVLTASVRSSALDYKRAVQSGSGIENIKQPEIWMTMNRSSRKDPITERFLARAEATLAQGKYYEDELCIIAQANYTDLPRDWWLASGLETERADDELRCSKAFYRHKWLGDYLETVENSIIESEWFDACIDAHLKLGFEAVGQEKVAYDPADMGDAKALAHMHGSVVIDVQQKTDGNIDTGTTWALEYTALTKPDVFIWDSDGIGGGLVSQINIALAGKKIDIVPFKGQNTAEDPYAIYGEPDSTDKSKGKSNKEQFFNMRAQMYIRLRDKIFRTYLAVTRGKYYDPEDMISFSSSIKEINNLRSELCRIPRNPKSARVKILSKAEMKAPPLNLASPNMADVVMMLQRNIEVDDVPEEFDIEDFSGHAGSWMS
jgi:phage terminase large subunit